MPPRPVAYALACGIAGIDLAMTGADAGMRGAGAVTRKVLCGNEYRTLPMRRAALRPVLASMLGDDDWVQWDTDALSPAAGNSARGRVLDGLLVRFHRSTFQ